MSGQTIKQRLEAHAKACREAMARGDARPNLTNANLTNANLTDADLTNANLYCANLTGALHAPAVAPKTEDERSAWLADFRKRRSESYAERAKRYREQNPDVPVVEGLDSKILDAVTSGAGKLDMSCWHGEGSSCATTHCRAGWAIHLAGQAGYDLERKLGGPSRAGAAIYRASTGRVTHFYESNESALEDLRACAAAEAKS